MPRGKYTNHKGRNRRFTNPEELEEQRRREEKERQWRAEHGEESSSEEEVAAGDKKKESEESSGTEESDSSSDDEGKKAKGVEKLIEVTNPNRIQKKVKKLSTLNETVSKEPVAKPELSRRERDELEKVRATAHYQKLHAEGKTEEARADLARLAIIKQQRADAAQRREVEKLQKEVAKQIKTAQTQKALGKRAT